MDSNTFLPKTIAELVDLLGLIPHPEGGFFLETFRSGSTPMASRGQSDYDVPAKDLVTTIGRETQRPDGNVQRNALTSIYWCPTVKSPTMWMVCNTSDHVHYYQGGLPFEYHLFNVDTQELQKTILGPSIRHGHVLQLPVSGGSVWKCGRLLTQHFHNHNNDNDQVPQDDDRHHHRIEADYSLIGEAVGPGFDFHDFRFVQEAEVDTVVQNEGVRSFMKSFLRQTMSVAEIDDHYADSNAKQVRTLERI